MVNNKVIVLLTIIGLAGFMITGCTGEKASDATSDATSDVVSTQAPATEATDETKAEVPKSSNDGKMEVLSTAMKIQGVFSDDFEYMGCISYYEEHPGEDLEWTYSGDYVVESDWLAIKRNNDMDNVGIDISAWKNGDFATVMINLNEYCPMYCDKERYAEGTLNKDNFSEYVSLGKEYSFVIYNGDTNYDGSVGEESVCVVSLKSPAYITLTIDSRGYYVTPTFYIEKDDVYMAHAYDKNNGLVLPLIYSDGYNCNDILGKRYMAEIKVNGEVIDYNGNSEQLFATYDDDRNDLSEWQKEGRYYVHQDGSSCKRLAFYYNVAEIEDKKYVEWNGVMLSDISKCPGCTNKIELAGKEITTVKGEAIYNDLKEAGGYRMTVEKSKDTIKLYGPTADGDMYKGLSLYLMDYDAKNNTTLYDQVIVNRKLPYK